MKSVNEVVAELFAAPEGSIADSDSPKSIAAWTSLSHLNLVLALEAEFNVEFSPEDAMNMLSIGAIKEILQSKLAE